MKKTIKNIARNLFVFMLVLQMFVMPVRAADMDMEFDDATFSEAVWNAPAGDMTVMADISAPSAILMEKETGEILYEKSPDERRSPASVTKVMTILLIVEAVENGKISLEDTVTVSAYAASMGGSQVFLEEGEQMPVSEMLKCIVVSSANDAAVAMAEHISGSEEGFAALMNERAASLGMENSHFTNCTGLLESDDHYTTARDIAIMSRELIKYDWIKDYTTIWMDTIRNGEFGLSNTNKLIRYYNGATGLKTGFTQKAGYCLAATAERDGMELIAVVMHGDTSVNRFESAKAMLNYGFANFTVIDTAPEQGDMTVPVTLGKTSTVKAVPQSAGSIVIPKTAASTVTKTVTLEPSVTAPVAAGQQLGTLTVASGEGILAEIPLVAECDVPQLTWQDIFFRMMNLIFVGKM